MRDMTNHPIIGGLLLLALTVISAFILGAFIALVIESMNLVRGWLA